METELNLTHNMQNIFSIDHHENYVCDILHLSGEYPVLWVRATERGGGPKHVDVVFRGVYYFEGPTQWVSANFCTVPLDECISMLDKFGWLSNIADMYRQEYIDGFSLIKVGSPPFLVKMLVRSAYLSGGTPPEFQTRA